MNPGGDIPEGNKHIVTDRRFANTDLHTKLWAASSLATRTMPTRLLHRPKRAIFVLFIAHGNGACSREDPPCATFRFSHRRNGYRRSAADRHPPLRTEGVSTPPVQHSFSCARNHDINIKLQIAVLVVIRRGGGTRLRLVFCLRIRSENEWSMGSKKKKNMDMYRFLNRV